MATDTTTALLTLEERAICERVGAVSEAPHRQRAQAILALDKGLSHVEASERAGLTVGQVKYWLNKFRQQRTGIFPEALLAQPESAKTPEKEPKPERVGETPEESRPAEMDGKKVKKSKKSKAKKKKSKKANDKSAKKKAAKKVKSKKKKDKKKKKSKK